MSIETASYPNAETPGEAKQALVNVLSAFEEFKQANDARLDEIEKRHSADVLLEEKLSRINGDISRLNAIVQRPALDRLADTGIEESKAAFDAYMRGHLDGAEETRSGAVSLEPNNGSLAVPAHIELGLNENISQRSAFRHLVSETVLDSASSLTVMARGATSNASWVGENAERSPTAAAPLALTEIPLCELYASPMATQRFIDDTDIDVEAWLLDEMTEQFASAENAALINGTGDDQPKGITTYSTAKNYNGERDKIGVIHSGSSKGLAKETATQRLLDVVFALPSKFRSNASWLMSASTQATIRGLKDANQNYIWEPSHQLGDVPKLFGFNLYDEAGLPAIGSSTVPVIFGNFMRAYRVVRARHTVLMRDPYSAKPNVIFYATRRIGGAAIDLNAVRALKISV